ncbi:ALP1-like protein [Tanacetum coccineum]
MARPLFKLIVNEVTNHEEKHGFPGMLGSLNCTDWEWFGYPNAFKGQYVRRDHAPKIPCVANDVTYPWGYYLVDGIYLKLATLIKTIPELADDDNKRILYKLKQESARKDLERAFGVLKKKLAILANPARALKKERIKKMVYTCIILHNMIRKFKGVAISPTWFLEEAHKPDDLGRTWRAQTKAKMVVERIDYGDREMKEVQPEQLGFVECTLMSCIVRKRVEPEIRLLSIAPF